MERTPSAPIIDLQQQRLARRYREKVDQLDRQPLDYIAPRRPDLYASFAEQHQADPDEATRQAVHAEISDALLWLGLGALAGSFATLLSAWIIAQVVL